MKKTKKQRKGHNAGQKTGAGKKRKKVEIGTNESTIGKRGSLWVLSSICPGVRGTLTEV